MPRLSVFVGIDRPLCRRTFVSQQTIPRGIVSARRHDANLSSPFLQFVSDTTSFDDRLQNYIQTNYVQKKYASQAQHDQDAD